jgi:hypothetical protein
MTTKTFGRVQVSVDAVTNQVISTMRCQAPGIRMILDRRFQAGTHAMTIATKTGWVAHIAHVLATNRRQPVVVAEQRGVFVAPEREAIGLRIMAGRTLAQITLFLGVLYGKQIVLGPCRSDLQSSQEHNGCCCDCDK